MQPSSCERRSVLKLRWEDLRESPKNSCLLWDSDLTTDFSERRRGNERASVFTTDVGNGKLPTRGGGLVMRSRNDDIRSLTCQPRSA